MKPQDCVVLLKLLARSEYEYSQSELAVHLCISASEVNASIKRLIYSGFLRLKLDNDRHYPIKDAAEEFFIHGIKYVYPVQLGEYTRGIPTSYAAPIFKDQIVIGKEPIPVWPYVDGKVQGLALTPLYRSVPESLTKYPDQEFYGLLALIDAIRQGRARERNIAIKLLKQRLKYLVE